MVVIELQIVLTAPHDLHGLADLPRQQGRFRNVVRLRLAPEAAAEQRYVADDVLFRNPERLGHRVLHRLRVLRVRPGGDLAVLELGDSSGRFHWRVREQRRVVPSLYYLAALRELGVDVADLACDAS